VRRLAIPSVLPAPPTSLPSSGTTRTSTAPESAKPDQATPDQATKVIPGAIPFVGPSLTPQGGIPLALFPSQAAKKRSPSELDEDRRSDRVRRGLEQPVDQKASDGRYLPGSTVPNVPGGDV
jgi:hypothetical protein